AAPHDRGGRALKGPRPRHRGSPSRCLPRAESRPHHAADGGAEHWPGQSRGRHRSRDGRRPCDPLRRHGRAGHGRGAANPPAGPEPGESPMINRGLMQRVTESAGYWILPVVMLVGLALMPGTTWVTLTVAGLAMGVIVFMAAAGMSLV